MPSGRTLQCATVHQYRDNFAKAYEITYEAPDGGRKFAHQTTFGMSERLVGATIGVHGDDRGLVLPPTVAPIQVVVIPIIFKGKEAPVLAKCKEAVQRLTDAGHRVHFDEREKNAGEKYFHWELRGVPLRVEIGPRDLEKGNFAWARRDGGKGFSADKDLEAEVNRLLAAVQTALHEKQHAFQTSQVHRAKKIEEARKQGGIVVLPVCDQADCGHGIEEALDYKTLGVPMDEPSTAAGEACAHCGKPAKDWIRFARTY
jgi:prolyl-tRNA synthetase